MIQKKILKPFLCLLCILAILASAGCGMMGELLNVLEEEPKPESTEDLTQPSREPYTRRYYSSDVERFDVPLGERSREFLTRMLLS